MADAAVSTVVDKLTGLVGQEVISLLQVAKDVKLLADKFEWLQALLNDAEQQRRTSENPFVALWIKQARDTAFEMEDVLDDFSRKVETVRFPGYGNWKDVLKFGWATECFDRFLVRRALSSKIANIQVKLAELDADKQTYNLELNPSSSWAPSLDKTIPTWAKEDYSKTLVGLDSQARALITQLKDGADDQRRIISIVGRKGSGTVMLARKAYDSSEIQSHFEVIAWKNLPPMFRLKKTLGDIYYKLLKQEDIVEEDCTEGHMGKALRGLLRNRRYLIVLNGLDNLICWKKIILSQYLPDDKNGSRIILIPKIGSEFASLSNIEGVTPFNQTLSFRSEESIKLFLQRFPEKSSSFPIECGIESIKLFLQRFPKKSSFPIEYREYIRQIHEVTKGNPTSIVLLAGLLGSKDEVSDWKEVFEYLKASQEAYRTDRILSLCFDDLPHQLKSCLMYFAAVPQTAGIEASRLVRRWIAEGFVQERSGKRMEEVGEGYLKELISRSLVRIEEKDEFGGPAVVAIDGSIHSFLQSEAEESSFVGIHDNAILVSPAKIRRLSIQNYTQTRIEINNSLPKLRTLLCDGSEKIKDSEPHQMRCLLKSKYLRVLDLHGINIKQLPSGISSMIHLRYLGIHCSTFDELPSSIGRLQNLQTLDIRKSSVKNVPNSFWRILTLRHVLSDRVILPKHIGEHIHLQTLQTADCTNWNKKNNLLENIRNIQILKLEELSTDQAENIRVSFSNLAFLKHLSLKVREGNHISIRIFTMGSLQSLQTMELHGELHDLEKEEKDLGFRYCMPNLIILTLIMSKLGQKIINYMSKLPSLTKLRILKSYDGRSIEFHPNGFQKLQELKLSGLIELEKWKKVPEGALPKLKNLILIGCPKFKSFPKGLQNLKQLEEISVYNMDEIIQGIREKTGDNYEKIKHVKTIRLRRDSNVDYSSTRNVSD